MAWENARQEILQRLRGGVDVQRSPCLSRRGHHLVVLCQDPTVFGFEVFRGGFKVIWDVELRREACDVVDFGQHAEILLFDVLRIDLEVVTHLSIARFPEAETFASNLVRLEGNRAVGSLDAPTACAATGSTFDDGIGIDAVAKRFRHFSPPWVHAQTVNPDVFERRPIEEKCALQHGVIQPCADNFLALGSKGGREASFEAIVVLKQTAHKEVGV